MDWTPKRIENKVIDIVNLYAALADESINAHPDFKLDIFANEHLSEIGQDLIENFKLSCTLESLEFFDWKTVQDIIDRVVVEYKTIKIGEVYLTRQDIADTIIDIVRYFIQFCDRPYLDNGLIDLDYSLEAFYDDELETIADEIAIEFGIPVSEGDGKKMSDWNYIHFWYTIDDIFQRMINNVDKFKCLLTPHQNNLQSRNSTFNIKPVFGYARKVAGDPYKKRDVKRE